MSTICDYLWLLDIFGDVNTFKTGASRAFLWLLLKGANSERKLLPELLRQVWQGGYAGVSGLQPFARSETRRWLKSFWAKAIAFFFFLGGYGVITAFLYSIKKLSLLAVPGMQQW